ncbi:MAG: protein arginine kinase [Gracilibacteraceae bacterium]|nr:protein arginine kinase [Gracilibacteraceae bacterium]
MARQHVKHDSLRDLQGPSRWMQADPQGPNILVSTRVRLARNLAGFPFPHAATPEQCRELEENMASVFSGIKLDGQPLRYLSMNVLSDNEKRILVERHLMSPDFANLERPRALFLSEDHRVAVMINEEDHIRIQVFEPNWQYQQAWELASELDNKIEEKEPLSFHEKFGYLTACPTNVGTGLRLSVMIHLPGLSVLGQIREITGALTQMGLTVRGLYGEKSQAYGNLYQISNQITLGKSEEDTMRHLDAMTQKIVEKEMQARHHLGQESRLQLEDRVWRARGTLQNARILSTEEAFKTLSLDRLGMDLDILPKIKVSYMETLINCLRGTLGSALGSGTPEVESEQSAVEAAADDKPAHGERTEPEDKLTTPEGLVSPRETAEMDDNLLDIARASYLRRLYEGPLGGAS